VHIFILGAGIAGLTTAYQLSARGMNVTVIEREPEPAMGASYANGAQLSVSNALPMAHPSVFFHLYKSLVKNKGGLFFKLHFSASQWRWIYHFISNCRAAVAEANLIRIAKMCVRSQELYYQLFEQIDMKFDLSKSGILHFYFDNTAYKIAQHETALLRQVAPQIRTTVDKDKIIEIEPALKAFSEHIVGGFYSAEDAVGDARLFCLELERICKQRGVEFLYNTRIEDLKLKYRESLIDTSQGDFRADHVVCCLGVYTPLLLKKIGILLHIYPLKGYSITLELDDDESQMSAPKVSLLDDQYKIVASRLGQRLRIAGIAELNNYDLELNPQRIAYLKQWVHRHLPGVSINRYTSWAGLRPATPSNLPYVGNAYHKRLWLNSGHGSLGWTAAMATAEAVCNGISADL